MSEEQYKEHVLAHNAMTTTLPANITTNRQIKCVSPGSSEISPTTESVVQTQRLKSSHAVLGMSEKRGHFGVLS